LRPFQNQVFGPDELRSSRRIDFSWTSVAGANAYIFSLFRGGDNARTAPIVRSAPLRGLSYTLQDLSLLDVGIMVWQVEAVYLNAANGFEQRGRPAESRFTIDISLPSSPKLNNEETYGRVN
jgi:hypothetical protein